jgi:hypothetical protein
LPAGSPGRSIAEEDRVERHNLLARTPPGRDGARMRNSHERTLPAGPTEVGELLTTAGQPGDRLWPGDRWPRMKLDGPVAVGARGGHGPIRYWIESYEPNRSLTFRFDPAIGMHGTHHFEIEPASAEGRTVLRHEIDGRTSGTMALVWPLAIRWFHDAVLEELLDNAERAVGGEVDRPARWSPWVRVLRRLTARRGRRPSA